MEEAVLSISWVKSGLVGDACILPSSKKCRIGFALRGFVLTRDKNDSDVENLIATLKFCKTVGNDEYVGT